VHLQHLPPAGNGGAGMRWIVVGVAVLGSLAGFIEPADACHHFRYWGYKTPQRCGVAPHWRVAVRSHPVVKVVSRPSTAAPPAPKPETAVPKTAAPLTLPPAIPLNMILPGLTDVVSSAVWGAEPDEETRVRMLTHAAFSSASPPSAADLGLNEPESPGLAHHRPRSLTRTRSTSQGQTRARACQGQRWPSSEGQSTGSIGLWPRPPPFYEALTPRCEKQAVASLSCRTV
jgi:hypothetical protein